MTFKEKIANYVLGNYSISQLPEIALTGLMEGIKSDALIILAGMSGTDNSFEIEQYFNKTLRETKIHIPEKIKAAKIVLRYYLNEILLDPQKAFEIMNIIHDKVYANVYQIQPKNFFGEELGLEHMYTWYRELQDFSDNSMLLYYNDLPRDEQKTKFEYHLVEEARILFEKLT